MDNFLIQNIHRKINKRSAKRIHFKRWLLIIILFRFSFFFPFSFESTKYKLIFYKRERRTFQVAGKRGRTSAFRWLFTAAHEAANEIWVLVLRLGSEGEERILGFFLKKKQKGKMFLRKKGF
ncbi:hypothetical protein V6Z12_A06G192000 [Gossypium hirsutum]